MLCKKHLLETFQVYSVLNHFKHLWNENFNLKQSLETELERKPKKAALFLSERKAEPNQKNIGLFCSGSRK